MRASQFEKEFDDAISYEKSVYLIYNYLIKIIEFYVLF